MFSTTNFLRIAISSLLLFSFAGFAVAQSSLENFFKTPMFGSAVLSPDGKSLATTTNIGGRYQLAVLDVESKAAKNIAGYEKLDVAGIRWISNERIAFNVMDRSNDRASLATGLYAVNRDGSNSVVLMESLEPVRGRQDLETWASELRHIISNEGSSPTILFESPEHMRARSDMAALRGMQMVSTVNDEPGTIIALGIFENRDTLPFRVDTLTGKRKEIDFDVKGRARTFIFDGKGKLRVVVISNAAKDELTVWYRAQVGQTWRQLSSHTSLDPKFTVLDFDADDTTMLVSAPTSAGRLGIFKYDFAANKPGEMLASDKSADVGDGLVFSPDAHKLLGVRMQTEPPRTVWFDKSLATLQTGVDKAYPGMVNVIQPGNAGAALLIHSYSSTQPGSYALYYPEKKKLQNLFATRPWVDSKNMSEQRVYDYAARDGLPIVSYLTLPQGREAKALPLVVNVHAGPWDRDHWGFNNAVQFLASLGYAVLQPQFRGSTGFGDAHFRKSFGQWGLSMQDDITDGINSLVKQGIVDPKRICIMGANYGGYAAVMGLVKDADLYRCGIGILGATIGEHRYTQDLQGDRQSTFNNFKVMVGDPDKMREQFIATSPAAHAEKIRAPIFLANVENGAPLPLIRGEELRDALVKHKKVHTYMELRTDERNLAQEETRYRLYRAIEAFLTTYNPAK